MIPTVGGLLADWCSISGCGGAVESTKRLHGGGGAGRWQDLDAAQHREMLSAMFTIASGGSIGREGPLVQSSPWLPSRGVCGSGRPHGCSCSSAAARQREDGAGIRYGAHIVAIEGNFDQALEIVRALGQREDFAVVNSINPDRIAGRRQPPSRSSMNWATRRTCICCRSATPATSPLTGPDMRNFARLERRREVRG